jgi:hypothetical protein
MEIELTGPRPPLGGGSRGSQPLLSVQEECSANTPDSKGELEHDSDHKKVADCS